MEDFLDLEHTHKLLHYFCTQYPKEACGAIVNRKWIACRNDAVTPENDFVMNTNDWIKVQMIGKPFAIVHSHPRSGCAASEFDLVQCKNLSIPFIIVSLRDWNMEIYK